jgi:hypothetical protein
VTIADRGQDATMRRLLAVTVAMAALTFAAPAGAITNGTADGQSHRSVGGLVAAEPYSTAPSCTARAR